VRRLQEAISGAHAAGAAVQADQHKADRNALAELLRHFQTLKRSLMNRLMAGVTDFKRFSLQALLADVDRLLAETEAAIQTAVARDIESAADRGAAAADNPAKAAGIMVAPALPGLDANLVQAGFGNAVDLLTLPMRQFGADVKGGLRRVALAGDNKFEEIQKLRDKIGGAGFDAAQFKAERIIRTEVGRVFNAAQFARMTDLAKTFPFLRKGWRATKDGRTRIGHRQAGATYARGQGIPVADLFTVQVYDERPGKGAKLIGTAKMRFPIDPEATPAGKVAAGATIMCRCNGFTDFSPADLDAYNRQRTALALGGVLPPVPPPVVPPPVVPPAKRVRPPKPTLAPKSRLPKPVPPPAVRNMNDPVQARAALADMAAKSPLTGRIKVLTTEVERLTAELKGLADEFRTLGRKLTDDAMTAAKAAAGPGGLLGTDWSNAWQAATSIKYTNLKWMDLNVRQRAISQEISNHANMITAMKGQIQADGLKLIATNPAERIALAVTYHGKTSQSPEIAAGVKAFLELTSAQGMIGQVTMTPARGRGKYSAGTIHAPDRPWTIVHELGHWMEDKVPGVHDQAVAFLVRRTAGEAATRLKTLDPTRGYKSIERATGDKFADPYAGKWYTYRSVGIGRPIPTFTALTKYVRASEVVSMGLQHLFEDPVGFALRDPDYFDFAYSIARQIRSQPIPVNAWEWNHVDGVTQVPDASGKIPKLAKWANPSATRPRAFKAFGSGSAAEAALAKSAAQWSDADPADYFANKPIKAYAGTSDSFAINNALRQGLKDPQLQAKALDLAAVLNKTDFPADVKTYRAINAKTAAEQTTILDGFRKQIGGTITDNAFVSTTANKTYADKWAKTANGIQVTVLVPKGAKAAYIPKTHVTRQEWEILIQRGSRFVVKSVTGTQVVLELLT